MATSTTPLGLRASRSGVSTQYVQMDNYDGSSSRLYSTGAGKGLRIVNNSSNAGLGTIADSMVFSVPSSVANTPYDAVTIQSSTGNVGIGTTTPATLLEVKTPTAGASPVLRVSNDGTATGSPSLSLYRVASDFSEIKYIPGGGVSSGLIINNGRTTADSGILFQLNGTEKFRLNSNGNVGIGTTSPISLLNLQGFHSSGAETVALSIHSATTASTLPAYGFGMGPTGTEGYLTYRSGTGSTSAFGHKWFINDVEVMRIRGDGRLGIGTSAPGAPLDVSQGTAGSIALQATTSGTAMWKIVNPANGLGGGYNAAAAVQYVGKDTTTSRSINAGGSINASGADFAEWVDWSGVKPDMGSIVLYKGSYVVVSSPFTAAFIGNDTLDEKHAILVAFAGQLPVLVKGIVHEGDLIVANGDGTGRAVSRDQVSLAVAKNAVGVAWASSNDPGLKRVKVAVGIGLGGNGSRDIASIKAENAAKDKEIAELKSRLEKIEKALKIK